MVVQGFTVDLNKPLVFQVGHLEEHYQEWVHQPVVSKEGPRFFANDVMESLTRTKWWAVPVIWLPVVCWLFAKSIRMGHTIQEVILMALFGVFVWTLIEYSLHRFLFHIETKSYCRRCAARGSPDGPRWSFLASHVQSPAKDRRRWAKAEGREICRRCAAAAVSTFIGEACVIQKLKESRRSRNLGISRYSASRSNTAHYLIHGCHHKHPMDSLRLVFPPAGAAILCVPFWNVVAFFATPSTTPALFAGGLFGYVMYDCTHYYLHHGQPSKDPAKHLKRYHLSHHFRIQDRGFGITSSLWDAAFGTLPSSKIVAKHS